MEDPSHDSRTMPGRTAARQRGRGFWGLVRTALPAQKGVKSIPEARGAALGLALPNDVHAPTTLVQRLDVLPVALDIAVELRLPETRASGWRTRRATAWVPMPETAVDEDDSSAAGEHDIRSSRQVLSMETEAVSRTMQCRPDFQFRSRVLSAHATHNLTALRIDGWIGTLG